MRFSFVPIIAAALLACACSSGDSGPSTLDLSGELSSADDVPAHEIKPFEEKPEEFCKGQTRLDAFADYDYQCEEFLGVSKCVLIEENHFDESFYCRICGLKGDKMVCYYIVQ